MYSFHARSHDSAILISWLACDLLRVLCIISIFSFDRCLPFWAGLPVKILNNVTFSLRNNEVHFIKDIKFVPQVIDETRVLLATITDETLAVKMEER